MPITPKQHAAMFRDLAKNQRARMAGVLMKVGEQGVRLAKQRTQALGAVDTREFLRGWGIDKRPDGMALENTALDAPWAEMGRRPGLPPPLYVLARWAERRLGVGGNRAWSVARTIAQHIAERGTKGAQVLEWVRPRLAKMVETAIIKEINDVWSL